MNLFKINYLSKISEIFTEAFKLKKYRAMTPGLAVFSFIFMSPFVICSFIVAVFLFLFSFVFEANISLVKSLHSVVREEGQEVKAAAQLVIYWVSWPFIFFLYAVECLFLSITILLYAVLSLLVYIWTFGGIKFHLFAEKDLDISVKVKGKYSLLPIVFVLLSVCLLVLLPLIQGGLHLNNLYYEYKEYLFMDDFLYEIYPFYYNLSLLFSGIFSLFVMARHPRVKEEPTSDID